MSDNQEQYINFLKKIKEVEENTQKEIENHKKEISEKISQFAPDLKNAITSANIDGDKLIELSLEQSRKKATIETEKIIGEAKTKAENISSQIIHQNIDEIIDILLKGVE